MQTLSVVRPEVGGVRDARTSIAILFFVFLTACGGGDGGGGVPDDAPPASGSLDLSFSTDGIVTTAIGTFDGASALALQSDGKIVVAGKATILGVENFALARYNPVDGSLDATFGTGGTVATAIPTSSSSSAAALGLQTDGKIVVAGTATISGVENFALARYNPDGTLDTSFGAGGTVATAIPTSSSSSAAALGLQTDGKIVVAGKATILGVENFALARYNPVDGSLDTSFDIDGIVTTTIGLSSNAFALGLQTDGKIVVAGNADGNIALARYNPVDGSLDTSFDIDGIVTTTIGLSSNAFALGLQTDGKIVVAGNTTNNGLEFVFALARYNANGTLDTSFDTDGIVTTTIGLSSNAFALGLQTDGKIVVAGHATNGVDFFLALARYTFTGALDTTFGTSGIVTTAIGAIAGVSALALQSDGKIVAAGFADGSIALARYNP